MPTTTSREIRLASRPTGWPTPDNFDLETVKVPPPAEGQVLVRNLFMSVDPYMRGRMNDVRSYVPPFQVGKPLEGSAVGRVAESRAEQVQAGDIVVTNLGWREVFVAGADEVRVVDASVQPLSAYLGVLGTTGFTAWVGMRLFPLKPGETVFVSSAAGAVGSVAGQLAKLGGCRVVGSAGSRRKVELLRHELGFDAAFNYHEGDVLEQLNRAAPDGIDLYFDNVGGDHLEAALAALKLRGRIVACGAISHYNAEEPPPGPKNLALVITKRLTMRGFIVLDWMDHTPQFLAEVGGYLTQGKLHAKETIVKGLEKAPIALIDMMQGGNIGKMVVEL